MAHGILDLGRCIYGGIVPANPTNFPYTPRNPCPPEKFVPTPESLLVSEHKFRGDVLALIRDELRVPMVRWPGGNYVSSYHWEDGIGPLNERKRRPELAWGGEESNQFGTDELVFGMFCDLRLIATPQIYRLVRHSDS